jgi:hypothetical protein
MAMSSTPIQVDPWGSWRVSDRAVASAERRSLEPRSALGRFVFELAFLFELDEDLAGAADHPVGGGGHLGHVTA